jgi:uncharacterized membrane protein
VNLLTVARHWDFPRLPLGSVTAFLVGTVLLAGAIHICTILLVPSFAQSDGWSRLAAMAGEDHFAAVPTLSAESDGVAGLDPLFVNGACRLRLGAAPAGITVEARDRLWSLALYNPQGTIIFSLNDRTAVAGRLDMIVVNSVQNARIQASPTVEIDLTIMVESASDDLVALLRLYAPTPTAVQDSRRILAQAECLPAPSVLPAQTSGG